MKPNRCVRFCEHHEKPPVQRFVASQRPQTMASSADEGGADGVFVFCVRARLGLIVALSCDQVIEGGGKPRRLIF